MKLGCHMSIAKGFYNAGINAVEIGANTFQYFTRNPRGGKAKKIDLNDIKKLEMLIKDNDFGPLFAHASYTMNLCSDKEDVRTFAKELLRDDLDRLENLPRSYYIFHPGSHVKQGSDKGIEYIIESLNSVVTENNSIDILLEGMSGKGTEIGRSLEELAEIINGVKYNEKLGVCLDTCHLYSSGYDIVNKLDEFLAKVDDIIGLKRVKAMHLNDSKTEFNSKKDRHEMLGKGSIGIDAIANIINHKKLSHVVFNLETPNELDGYKKEIELLKERKLK